MAAISELHDTEDGYTFPTPLKILSTVGGGALPFVLLRTKSYKTP